MKTCTKCNIEKPKTEFHSRSSGKDSLRNHCKSCEAARAKAYRLENPELKSAGQKAWRDLNRDRQNCATKAWQVANPLRVTENSKSYRAANKEKISIAGKAWYKANKGKVTEYAKAYREENKIKISAAAKAYREANKEQTNATVKAWALANPERKAASSRNRRATQRLAEGTHTAADIGAIFTLQRGLCAICEATLFKSGKNKYHVDHIVALSKGGSNDKYNLQCLCPACNMSKGAKDPIEWAKVAGRLF